MCREPMRRSAGTGTTPIERARSREHGAPYSPPYSVLVVSYIQYFARVSRCRTDRSPKTQITAPGWAPRGSFCRRGLGRPYRRRSGTGETPGFERPRRALRLKIGAGGREAADAGDARWRAYGGLFHHRPRVFPEWRITSTPCRDTSLFRLHLLRCSGPDGISWSHPRERVCPSEFDMCSLTVSLSSTRASKWFCCARFMICTPLLLPILSVWDFRGRRQRRFSASKNAGNSTSALA